MPEQYLNCKKKISRNKIDLYLFYSYYSKYICSSKFIYSLENGKELEIVFESDNFPHLLGLHKFNKISSIGKAEDIVNEIICKNISMKELKRIDRSIFNEPTMLDRLTFFPTLRTILDSSQFLIEFDGTKCIPTKISANYFLYSDEINVTIFLAIREIDKLSNRIICCPVSFLVDRFNKFQKNKQTHISIKKINTE